MVGFEMECFDGGGFLCGFLIYFGMKCVKGYMEQIGLIEFCDMGIYGQEGDWEMVVLRKDKLNNGVYIIDFCICGNLDGKDDNGYFEKVCFEECVVFEQRLSFFRDMCCCWIGFIECDVYYSFLFVIW